MISKSQSKFIKSLQLKKYRKQEQCFIVEGEKGVKELIGSNFGVVFIVATEEYADRNRTDLSKSNAEVLIVTRAQLNQLGSFQSNESVIAVAKQKPNRTPQLTENEFGLLLDDIRDPGNLGTIIRTADWFGITKIIASEQTADFYNPKVISATMGSFTRIEFGYSNLPNYITQQNSPVYGAFLNGEDVHEVEFGYKGLIVMGNESNGISPDVERLISHRITIPGFGGAESLNASVATGIVLDAIRQSQK